MVTKAFFDKPEDATKVAARLEVETDCPNSVSASKSEVKKAADEEGVSTKNYSVADVETDKSPKS